MDAHGGTLDGSPVFDSLDVDLVIKVLKHTVFSPFFTFFIPVFYIFQGAEIQSPIVVTGCIYYAVVSLYWGVKWLSILYANQGNIFLAPKRLDWGDQLVVITGGSSGIGGLLASTLAVRSVSIAVLDLNPPETDNHNITYYKCDVSKWEEVDRVAKQIREELGEPTMLVNNAGVVQGKTILDLSEADVKQTFGVNTLGHFWILKAFLPGMIKQKKGHVVTVSSTLGDSGVAYMTDYCASKAATTSLHEALRYELTKVYKCPEIRTTLVRPAHVLTPLFRTIKLPSSSFRKFFFPSVAPVDVVKEIVAALDSQYSTDIVLPFYGYFMPWLKIVPTWAIDLAHWITGSDEAMTNFVKISGRRPEEGPRPEIPSFEADKKAI